MKGCEGPNMVSDMHEKAGTQTGANAAEHATRAPGLQLIIATVAWLCIASHTIRQVQGSRGNC